MKKIKNFQNQVEILKNEQLKKINGGDSSTAVVITSTERDKDTPIRPPH